MAYSPTTDFLALLRNVGGVATFAEMPGLDYVVAAMARAGLFRLWTGQSAPTVNQTTTVWLLPSSPSWVAEGAVFLWDAAASAYAAATPALWEALLGSATSEVDARELGCACDGVTDDGPALNKALAVPGRVVVIPAGRACRTSQTVRVNPDIGTSLRGADFDAGAYPSPTSARIIGDITVTPVVWFNGGNNGSMTLENIVIGRAAGTPGASTIGLLIQDGYNVVLRNVLSCNHGENYYVKGQVFNNSAGLGLNGSGVYSYGAVDAHFVVDSFAEVRLNQCRFGRNASAGDYSCNTHFRIKGGVAGTAGGPNTIYVFNSQFNQGTQKAKHFIEFVQLGAGGVGAIDATDFLIDGCHIEGLATAANGGAGIFSDASWNLLNRFTLANTMFLNPSTPLFALDPATLLTNFKVAKNGIYASTLTLAPVGAITGLSIEGNWLQCATSLAASGASQKHGAAVNNQFFGNYSVSGAWTRFSSIGNGQISGTRSVTATASALLVLDNGEAPVLSRLTSKFLAAASTVSYASLNLPAGAAPTAPANGDVWRQDETTAGLKIQVGGVTRTINLT